MKEKELLKKYFEAFVDKLDIDTSVKLLNDIDETLNETNYNNILCNSNTTDVILDGIKHKLLKLIFIFK